MNATGVRSPSNVRPRRSVLYMPGSNERALAKAKGLSADALIFDLEDAVAPDAKGAARDRVCRAVVDGGYAPREVVVRINALDTPWGREDLAAACAAGPDAILLPKVESADTVSDAERRMQELNASEHTSLWSMIETPLAVLNAGEIAAATARQTVWVMGTNDLAKDLQCLDVPGRTPLIPSLALCLLAARAHGLVILDGVYNALDDAVGFQAACEQGLALGFDGKTLIHPKQVEPCNQVFSPTPEALAAARRIIAAFEEASVAGKGVVVVEGRMVENLHVENARRLVAMGDAIAERS